MCKFIEDEFNGELNTIYNFLLNFAKKDTNFKKKLERSNQKAEDLNDFIREKAREQAKDGVAMIEDKVVYGWAIHFIDENIIFGNNTKNNQTISQDNNLERIKKENKVSFEKEQALIKKIQGAGKNQLSFFDD